MLHAEEVESARYVRLHFRAFYHRVKEPVFEQELGFLKTFGQFLANGLFDDARPRESNERARLSDIQIAQHREAGGHATGSRDRSGR